MSRNFSECKVCIAGLSESDLDTRFEIWDIDTAVLGGDRGVPSLILGKLLSISLTCNELLTSYLVL